MLGANFGLLTVFPHPLRCWATAVTLRNAGCWRAVVPGQAFISVCLDGPFRKFPMSEFGLNKCDVSKTRPPCCPTKSQKKRAGTKQVLAGTSRHYVSVLNSHRFFSDLSRHVAVVPPLEPPCPSMYVSRLILCATLIPFPTRWSMLTSQFPQVICAHLSSSPDSSPYPLTSIIPFQGR